MLRNDKLIWTSDSPLMHSEGELSSRNASCLDNRVQTCPGRYSSRKVPPIHNTLQECAKLASYSSAKLRRIESEFS